MRIAAKVRQEKEKHPARFCPNSVCLWRVWKHGIRMPCPKHMDEALAERLGKQIFANPAVCEGCGYPLVNHPRMGCASVDGRMSGPQPYPVRDPWEGTDEERP